MIYCFYSEGDISLMRSIMPSQILRFLQPKKS